MKQPWAWVTWLFAVLAVLSITRNPLYLLLIFMCVLFVGIALHQRGGNLVGPFSIWRLAVWIILLATLFNALTSHFGTTVLFTIPGKLPLVSGAVTIEALVYGATNGLVLTGMLAGFTVLSLALPIRNMISLIPRAFFPLAVVTSIAITYLPTTLRLFRQIREAQAVRGHQLRTLRDWLPLLIPLLVGGLEHAMQLAEAMTARGFAATRLVESKRLIYPRLLMLGGMILMVAGWLVQMGGLTTSGLIVIACGGLFILGGLWDLGRQSPRTIYHHLNWDWPDWLGIASALLVLAVSLLPLIWSGNQTLYYDPYPSLSLPPFSPFLGFAMLGLLLPGLLITIRKHDARPQRDSLKEGHNA